MKSMSTEKNELKKKTIKTLKGKETFRKEISGRLSQSECEKYKKRPAGNPQAHFNIILR